MKTNTTQIEIELLTVKETAALLRCSPKSLYSMIKKEKIKPIRVGGKILFSPEYLHRWLIGQLES